MTTPQLDLLVVGGGINGAGIARDAAGRGLSVLLCEQHDLAAHTSSSSTKLIHGGLRYLEHAEFSLVRKALAERELLLRSAPHLARPLRFVMPHDASMRPAWLIRLGLFLYDHLARRDLLPASAAVALARHPAGMPLRPDFEHGFEYSDGWVDDARLVVSCAIDAAERGASVQPRTRCIDAQPREHGWDVTLESAGGSRYRRRARMLVNATGPWAAQFLRDQTHRERTRTLRLVRGSHIVVPKLYDHPFAYLLQNTDRRAGFAIPYEGRYTLIGTTDVEHRGEPAAAQPSADEVHYLCTLVNRYFRRSISPADVVWSFAGVRPLVDDASDNPSHITRDYLLDLDRVQGAPMLSVWGGKITTFRRLAEQACDLIVHELGCRSPAWTARAVLPGGDLPGSEAADSRPDTAFDRFCGTIIRANPKLPSALLRRLARTYGGRIGAVLGSARDIGQLGEEIAPGLFEVEVRYLIAHEWAHTADDILWRRTKLGLHLTPAQREHVQHWIEASVQRHRSAGAHDAPVA